MRSLREARRSLWNSLRLFFAHVFFDTIYLLGAGESRADWNYSGRFYTTTLIYCLSMPWIESDGVDGRLGLALRPFQWPWLWRHFLWACWWNKWNQTYLSDISGELLHIQYLNFPLFFLCFSFLITNITRTLFLFDFRTTWFISPHSLSDTWRWIVWWCMKCCFLSFVCKPNVNDVLYWVCQPHSLWSQALSLSLKCQRCGHHHRTTSWHGPPLFPLFKSNTPETKRIDG